MSDQYQEERRTAKGWNDPPSFSYQQLNEASKVLPLHKRMKYKYPQPPSLQSYQQQFIPSRFNNQLTNETPGNYQNQSPVSNYQYSNQPQFQQIYQPNYGEQLPDPNYQSQQAQLYQSNYQNQPYNVPNYPQQEDQAMQNQSLHPYRMN